MTQADTCNSFSSSCGFRRNDTRPGEWTGQEGNVLRVLAVSEEGLGGSLLRLDKSYRTQNPPYQSSLIST